MQVFPEQSTTKAEREQWAHDRESQKQWRTKDTAPKDGTHILVCFGPYSEHWGFNQSPPVVVHYFEDGFYLSQGIVEGSYSDSPVAFTHWKSLGFPPAQREDRG